METWKELKRIGIKWIGLRLAATSFYYNNLGQKFNFDRKLIRKAVLEIAKMESNPLLKAYYTGIIPEFRPRIKCYSGKIQWFLDPYGGLHRCTMYNGHGYPCNNCWTECETLTSLYFQPLAILKLLLHRK